jgi:FAD/FMN-containing dehydrogenase
MEDGTEHSLGSTKKLIGCGKRDFLIAGHGEAVSLMHVIKKALDPTTLLIRGKSSGSKPTVIWMC